MRVIHGIWAHGALRVWGEDPELPPAPRDPAPAPAPHPFACPAAELADLLAALPGGRPGGRARPPTARSRCGCRRPPGRPGRWPRRTSSAHGGRVLPGRVAAVPVRTAVRLADRSLQVRMPSGSQHSPRRPAAGGHHAGREQRLALAGPVLAEVLTEQVMRLFGRSEDHVVVATPTLIRRTEFVTGKQHETSPTGGHRPTQPSNSGKTTRPGSDRISPVSGTVQPHAAEIEMPCRAAFMDDPLRGPGRRVVPARHLPAA